MTTFLQIATNIATPLALAGLVFTILFLVIRQILSSHLLRKITSDHTFIILMVVIRGLLWLYFAALLIGSASYFITLSFGSPLLHVSPSVRDAYLRWEDSEFSPHSTQGGDPFALTIKNIGDGNVINVTITFVLNLNTDELIMMA